MAAFGIDFGTTNSVLARFSDGEVDVVSIDDSTPAEWSALGYDKVLPSVYAHTKDGSATFGFKAKLQQGSKLEAVKRLLKLDEHIWIGGQEYIVEEVGGLLFGAIRSAANRQGLDFDRAVVTVPANSRGPARLRTKQCAGMAQIEVPLLINEPTAAAMAFGLRTDGNHKILVVDWGGGTLDVTFLHLVEGVFLEQSSKGVQALGGIDFDKTIYRQVTAEIPRVDEWSVSQVEGLLLELEKAKIRLSDQDEVSFELPDGSRRNLTRAQLEEWLQPQIELVREPIERCLSDARVDASEINHLLLVGGTCKIPAVRQIVSEIVGHAPVEGVDPMTAIAEGAAVAAAILAGESDSVFSLSLEHSLGIVLHDPITREPKFDPIIWQGSRVPSSYKKPFLPLGDNQDGVLVVVMEGDPLQPFDHDDNVVLRELDLPFSDKRPAREQGFEITFAYDESGILHISAMEQATGRLLLENDVRFAGSRDAATLERAEARVQAVLAAPTESVAHTLDLAAEVAAAAAAALQVPAHDPILDVDTLESVVEDELVVKARTRVLPFISDEEAEPIHRLLGHLAVVEGAVVDEVRAELVRELNKFAYLFDI